MIRINVQAIRETVRAFIIKVSQFMNKNTGWLICVAVVLFGLSNLAFLKDNEVIISQIKATTDNTENIAKDTKTIITNLEQAVSQLKADNREQTRILCRLILKGAVNLTPTEVVEVERICEEQIDSANDTPSTTPPVNQPSQSPLQPTTPRSNPTPQPTPNVPPAPENPAEEPTGIRSIRIVDRLLKLLGL